MPMHKSEISATHVAEFINLQESDISPMISTCSVKVCYIGQNRNGSYIDKPTATKISRTLRGNPIVGWYNENKGDFEDHGNQVTLNNSGVKFECLTRPYGFVAPDAKIWFQFFEDTDEFGNTVLREYMCTEGYLWTGQYPECQDVIENGRPQSMEFDEETLQGHWATDNKSGMEFFIINDATFTKLCILGNDIEPCFEGASVTKSVEPEITFSLSIDDKMIDTLKNMAQQINFALRGGQTMPNTETPEVQAIAAPVVEDSAPATQNTLEEAAQVPEATPETSEADFAKKDEEDKKDGDKSEEEKPDDSKKDDEEEDEKKKTQHKCGDDDDDEKKKKYALLETQFKELNEKYEALTKECEALKAFKATVEDQKKDELISSFSMLDDTDEVKAEVIANKAKYSLEEIESKLSVACFRKKVNFNLDVTPEIDNSTEEKPITTFSLESADVTVPAWLKAVQSNKNR